GALLSADKELISKARFLATQARDKAPHYQHSELGYNYRMSNIVAGIGRGQMNILNNHIAARRSNHAYYFKALSGRWFKKDTFNIIQKTEFGPTRIANGIYFLEEPQGFFSNRWLTTILVIPRATGGIEREDIRLPL